VLQFVAALASDDCFILSFSSVDDAILDILTNTESYNPNNLLAVGLIFFLLQVATFGVSLPSGIFMPTILTGASLGGYLGFFLQSYDPSVSPSVFSLLGAAALLSGMQRTTVSLCVILMEGTGQTNVLIPVIITIVVACYVGNLFNHGIYEVVMELKEFPYLEQFADNPVYDMFGVSNVMSTPVVVINSVECAGTIESMLLETTHNG
jgi:chloride channel 7